MKKQVHVYYSGRVQGVGFRFTAESVANEFGVAGWVKNLHGGRVEIVAEADEEVLKKFLGEIYRYFSRYMQDVEIEWHPSTDEFKDFGIRF
jgi:acylphosphatase